MKDKKVSILLLLGMSVALCVAIVVTGQDTAPVADAAGAKAPAGDVAKPAVPEAPAAAAPAVPAPAVEAAPAATAAAPAVTIAPAPVEPAAGSVAATAVEAPAATNGGAPVEMADDVDAAAVESAELKVDEGPAAPTSSDGKISLAVEDMEISDLIKMITRSSGMNVISSHSNLTGKVTVNLTDVEWRPALESILDMYNMTLEEKRPGSLVYSIVPKPSAEPMIPKTFFLRFSQVTNVIGVVSSVVTPGGTIQPFPSRNAFVIKSTAKNLGEIAEVIKAIDVMRDQVFIEAKFLELNDNAIKDLGISWQVLQGYSLGVGGMKMDYSESRTWDKSRAEGLTESDTRTLNDTINNNYDIQNIPYEETTTTYEEAPPGSGVYVPSTITTPTRTVTDTIDKSRAQTKDLADDFAKTVTDVRTAVISADDFKVMLAALKQMDGVQVVSNPKIMVANEEPARIHIGQIERPFISTVTPPSQNSGALVTYNPGDPVNIGLELTVTPTINTESNVTVRIEPSLRRFLRNSTAPNGQTYPIISEKRIHTVFCLESGKTVAIGGLTETRDAESGNKIPILGSIPILGRFFSYDHTEKSQSETIIFVTVGVAKPESVQHRDGLPEDTQLVQRRLIRDELQRAAFREEIESDRQKADAKMEKAEKVRAKMLNTK